MTTATCRGTDESPHKKSKVEIKHGIGRCSVCGAMIMLASKSAAVPKTETKKTKEAQAEVKPSRMSFEPFPDNDWAS